MKLSIVMPCYNEIHTIDDIVRKVLAVELPVERELVVVDDCSTDGTRERMETLNGSTDVRVLFHETNGGQGAALRSGFAHASGDIVLVQDADLAYDPDDYPKLFGFEPEVTARVAKLGCLINEVGISYYGRMYAQGKKIGWKDGVRAIYVILKYGLVHRSTGVQDGVPDHRGSL